LILHQQNYVLYSYSVIHVRMSHIMTAKIFYVDDYIRVLVMCLSLFETQIIIKKSHTL
jgi:hypothetical protein